MVCELLVDARCCHAERLARLLGDIGVRNADHGWSMTGPTAGIKSLRTAVANLYNAHHRKGKESQYTWENVCIVPGGRAGLIRIGAILNHPLLSFFVPDYTAYSNMLSLFKNVSGSRS